MIEMINNECDYLSMMGVKLIFASKRVQNIVKSQAVMTT